MATADTWSRHTSTTRDSGPGYVKPIAPVSRKTGLAIIPSAQGCVPSSSGDKFVHCSCSRERVLLNGEYLAISSRIVMKNVILCKNNSDDEDRNGNNKYNNNLSIIMTSLSLCSLGRFPTETFTGVRCWGQVCSLLLLYSFIIVIVMSFSILFFDSHRPSHLSYICIK